MRELIWQYPLLFAISVCVPVTILGVIIVIASFSYKQKDDD